VGSRKPLVFISYETSDGLQYADQAKAIFEAAGYDTWVWHHDRKSGAYTVKEIEENIRKCRHFVHICTKGSDESYGQDYERCTAWAYAKPFVIFAFDRAYVSPMLRPYNRNDVSPQNFGVKCHEVAANLRRQKQLRGRVTRYRREDEPIEPA
jgi:hypothetical protein